MSSPAVVLGFNALQLSDDRDSLAPHREPMPPGALTLRVLHELDWLSPARTDLVANPPRIRTGDARERAAIGYLSANCGGCHNSTGPLARLGFNLLHDAGAPAQAPEPALLTTVNTRGRFVVPGVPADSCQLVAPGVPQHSTLLYRMKSRRPSSQMPPLGSVVIDSQAVALIQGWIASLNADSTVRPEPQPRPIARARTAR